MMDCGIRSPLTGRAVKSASLFDGGRGQYLRTQKERGHYFCPRSDVRVIARAFWVGSSFCSYKFAVHFGFVPW